MSDKHAGGAERLVVDAALGLQKLGHSVDIYTSHHDPKHCFEETRDGKLPIVSDGAWHVTVAQELSPSSRRNHPSLARSRASFTYYSPMHASSTSLHIFSDLERNDTTSFLSTSCPPASLFSETSEEHA